MFTEQVTDMVVMLSYVDVKSFTLSHLISQICIGCSPSSFFTSKMWSPGANLPSRAAIESRMISWMTMFPSGVSFPPTMRKPRSSSGSSLNSSTVLASATRLERRGVLSGGKRGQRSTRIISLTVYVIIVYMR